MQWTKTKAIMVATALFILYFVGDAIAPKWDWECKGGGRVSDLEEGGRVMNPRIPKNCIAKPHSVLRKGFDYFYPTKPSDEL